MKQNTNERGIYSTDNVCIPKGLCIPHASLVVSVVEQIWCRSMVDILVLVSTHICLLFAYIEKSTVS